MERKYISTVKVTGGYILHVDFMSGSYLLLGMKLYLGKIRFRSLADPQVQNSAVTNGVFTRFDNVELSHDEILSMVEREHNSLNSMKKTERENECEKLEEVCKSFAGVGFVSEYGRLREKRQ